jgi:hypothetical protein
MHRRLLAAVLPFAAGLLGGTFAPPAILQAQRLAAVLMADSVTAQSVTVVGSDTVQPGSERVRLFTNWNGAGSDISLLGTDGLTPRMVLASGGISGYDPAASGINIYAEDGTQVARLGIGHGPLGNQPLNTVMTLFDTSGHQRIRLQVPEVGNPSIRILDAQGNVVWSAP